MLDKLFYTYAFCLTTPCFDTIIYCPHRSTVWCCRILVSRTNTPWERAKILQLEKPWSSTQCSITVQPGNENCKESSIRKVIFDTANVKHSSSVSSLCSWLCQKEHQIQDKVVKQWIQCLKQWKMKASIYWKQIGLCLISLKQHIYCKNK